MCLKTYTTTIKIKNQRYAWEKPSGDSRLLFDKLLTSIEQHFIWFFIQTLQIYVYNGYYPSNQEQ